MYVSQSGAGNSGVSNLLTRSRPNIWEIRLDGSDTQVRYGKIGTAGQAQTQSFDSPEAAQKSADKLVAEKIKGGYQELGAKPFRMWREITSRSSYPRSPRLRGHDASNGKPRSNF